MLLTLSAISLKAMLTPGRDGKAHLSVMDLPEFTRQVLRLHGMTLPTHLLAGMTRDQLERLRERADKAGAACLLLVETEPQPFGDESPEAGAGAVDRLHRVIEAGHLLGCNAVAVRLAGPDDPQTLARTVERLRRAVRRAERLELNVLVAPMEGLTAAPERVTELIKKVGGFRVGTYPDFQAAAASPDPEAYLRRLTPYASVVCASTVRFAPGRAPEGEAAGAKKLPRHSAYDLAPLVHAITAVGYDGTLAIEYRGAGDATLGVTRTRQTLESLLHQEAAEGEA
jgi:sugar phosphate isomerase/epimerase